MLFNMNCRIITSEGKEKGGKEYKERYKFVQTLIHPDKHKALRRLALEQDVTLAELLQEVIEFYLHNSKNCRI